MPRSLPSLPAEPTLPLTVPDAPVREVKAPSYLADHRLRLRERFEAGGALAMPDYELLELLLFRSIPRRDVKPLARALLGRFGDLGRVLAASLSDLSAVEGVGPVVALDLKLVEAISHRTARARIIKRPVLSDWQALLDYCHAAMGHRPTEQFRILFLDTKNVLVADEEQASGTIDHVPVYPREVVKRALELNAKALILVHNHPSGDATPSRADVEMTHRIARACEALDLVLHDHLVIGKGQEVSFRAAGYL